MLARSVVSVGSRLGVLVPLLLAGCGEEPGGRVSSPEPPLWRRAEVTTERHGFLLEARSPCRVSFRHEGEEAGGDMVPPRRLAAGEVVRVEWTQEVVPPNDATLAPPEDEAAAGRTEGWLVRQRLALQDTPVALRTKTVWARPGLAQALEREATPPSLPQAIPFGEPVELTAAAIADVERGKPSLVAGSRGTRLRMPDPPSEGDRGTLLRVWVEASAP